MISVYWAAPKNQTVLVEQPKATKNSTHKNFIWSSSSRIISHAQHLSSWHWTMPGTIRVGCKVSGLIGPKLPLTGTQKRRTRQRFFGTVVKSCPNQKWTVYWHEIDRCADHSFNSLKYETNSGMNLSGVNMDSRTRCRRSLWSPEYHTGYLGRW